MTEYSPEDQKRISALNKMAENPKFGIDLKNFDIDEYLKHCKMFESPEINSEYRSLSMSKEVREFREKYSQHMENKAKMKNRDGNSPLKKIEASGKKRHT